MGVMDAFRGLLNPAASQPRGAPETTGGGGETFPSSESQSNESQSNNSGARLDNGDADRNLPEFSELNSTIPNSTNQKKQTSAESDPLANYKDLWKVDPNAKSSPTSPQLTIDPEKLNAAAKGIDFTKGLDPEMLRKASSGDSEAFAGILNSAAQSGFAQSTALSAQLVQRALDEQAKMFRETILPEALKRHEVSSGLREESAVYDNPAVSPVLQMIESSLHQKYPTASPKEIRDHALSYMDGLVETVGTSRGMTVSKRGKAGTGNGESRGTRGQVKETDWMELMTEGNTPGRW